MKKDRLLRLFARRRRLRGKAMREHMARLRGCKDAAAESAHAATTQSGLTVEEQVRKKWGPHMGVLA
jgi:hypothetical protein